jgi:hypothetical protein
VAFSTVFTFDVALNKSGRSPKMTTNYFDALSRRIVHFALVQNALDLDVAAGRKRVEAYLITGPAWMLKCCTFVAATGATRRSP